MLVKDFVAADADFLGRMPRTDAGADCLSTPLGNADGTWAVTGPSHP